MIRKYYPWLIFLAVFLLLAFSASPYAKAIDSILWPIRIGILAGFSLLFLWSWCRHRADADAQGKPASKDSADHFLASARRWMRGDQKN
jgi:NhaP-type Na+/H+ or K+/H+ antiporter